MQYPLVTLVLVNFNGKHYLERFLPTVFASSYPAFEIVLIDNASADDSLVFLSQNYPQIRVYSSGGNFGFAKGNNLAIPYINTEFAVLLNTDVEVTEGWLEPLVAAMLNNPTWAACQPKVLAYHRKTHFEYAGACGGWIDAWGYPFCRGRIFDVVEPDNGQYNQAQSVFWATGACMIVRMAVVKQIGLFDEFYFAHWEEIDFCWRAHNFGYSIGVEPKSIIYHVGGGTLPKASPRKTYLNFRNSLITLLKNLPLVHAFCMIIVRLILDGIAGLKGIKQPAYTWAIIRAHFGFYRAIPHALKNVNNNLNVLFLSLVEFGTVV